MLVYVLVLSFSSSFFLINLDQSSLIIGNVVLSIPSCSYQVKINFLKTADDWIPNRAPLHVRSDHPAHCATTTAQKDAEFKVF